METYHGYVRTPADAIKLFEACRLGLLPRVQRRLSEKERQLIKSGSVFVWDEREAGMRRWTDGKSWSASRVSGSFLTYREMEGKRGGQFTSPLPPPRQVAGTSPESGQGSDEDVDEEGPDGYRYKPNGLMKQSFSITTSTGQHLHLISYYSRPAPNAVELCQPTLDPQLRHITPIKGMYPEATMHEAHGPTTTRTPIQPSPFPQSYQTQLQHIRKSSPPKAMGGQPSYQFSHSPEYQWSSSPVAASLLIPCYSSSTYNNPHLPQPNQPKSSHTPIFHYPSSPLQSHLLRTSHPPQSAVIYDRSPPCPNNSVLGKPERDCSNHSSSDFRRLSSTTATQHRQNLLSAHTSSLSPRRVAQPYSVAEQAPAKKARSSLQIPTSTPLTPILDSKISRNSLPAMNSSVPPASQTPYQPSSSNSQMHLSSTRNIISLNQASTPFVTHSARASSIPSISNLVLVTGPAPSKQPNNFEETNTVSLEYWKGPSSKIQDLRADFLHEKLNLMGEDQRAIRVLDRKFCV